MVSSEDGVGASADPSSGGRRNIAVFIDGTWNRGNSSTPTNVRKLFEATPKGTEEGVTQLALYIAGVGSKPGFEDLCWADGDYTAQLGRLLADEFPPRTPAGMRAVIGGASGKGTSARIRAAYLFICRHYRERSSDRVFLFGFSRGAFAVRSLAGFLDVVGLLLATHLSQVEKAWRLYEGAEDPSQSELQAFLYKLTGFRRAFRDGVHHVPLHFLGVWDTVASLGLPSRCNWLTAPFTEFHQVDVPPAVMTARHALASHELRDLFEPLLWRACAAHTDLQQVWFPGSHADVGGGYRPGEDVLSDNALRWMASEAERVGLRLATEAPWPLRSHGQAAVHHEIRKWFLASVPTPRRWLGTKGLCEGHHVHASLVDYLLRFAPEYRHRIPFVNAALRHVDELALARALHLRLQGRAVLP